MFLTQLEWQEGNCIGRELDGGGRGGGGGAHSAQLRMPVGTCLARAGVRVVEIIATQLHPTFIQVRDHVPATSGAEEELVVHGAEDPVSPTNNVVRAPA